MPIAGYLPKNRRTEESRSFIHLGCLKIVAFPSLPAASAVRTVEKTFAHPFPVLHWVLFRSEHEKIIQRRSEKSTTSQFHIMHSFQRKYIILTSSSLAEVQQTEFTLPVSLKVLIAIGCMRPLKHGTVYRLLVTHYFRRFNVKPFKI